MHYLITYLYHLCTASNQHGVHSPFVYNYVTKCLYTKARFSQKKYLNVLLKSSTYFAVKSLTTIPKNAGIETEIEKALQLPLREEFPTDLLYFEYPPADNLLGYEKKLHNDSMIFIANIHRKSASSARWKKLTTSTQVTVSIDLFYCGILFIRKEQAKEHFKIRI